MTPGVTDLARDRGEPELRRTIIKHHRAANALSIANLVLAAVPERPQVLRDYPHRKAVYRDRRGNTGQSVLALHTFS